MTDAVANRRSIDDLASPRDGDPAPASGRRVADRHHRASTARASRHRAPRVVAERCAGGTRGGSDLQARSVSAVHPGDLRSVSDVAREPAVSDGARARLRRQLASLPAHGRPASTAAGGRGLPAASHLARRTSTDRLGALRQAHHRPRAAAADGLRDGALVLAPSVRALLLERHHRQLFRRPRSGLRVLYGRAASLSLR